MEKAAKIWTQLNVTLLNYLTQVKSSNSLLKERENSTCITERKSQTSVNVKGRIKQNILENIKTTQSNL